MQNKIKKAIVDPKQPFKYKTRKVPTSYSCSKCGATKVKLWRDYNSFLDQLSLYCADCAGIHQKVDTSKITAAGKINWRSGAGKDMGLTDQIGGLIPAVPTETNDTFWGYSSVPDAGCVWWRRLPSRPGAQGERIVKIHGTCTLCKCKVQCRSDGFRMKQHDTYDAYGFVTWQCICPSCGCTIELKE